MECQLRRVSSRLVSSLARPIRPRLTFNGINDDESSVGDSKSCCDLRGEVNVARGVCESGTKM